MGAEPKQHPAPPGPTSATCPLIQRPSRLWGGQPHGTNKPPQKGRPTDEDGKQEPDPATDGEPKSRREQPAVNTVPQQPLSATPGPRARTYAAPPPIPREERGLCLYHIYR